MICFIGLVFNCCTSGKQSSRNDTVQFVEHNHGIGRVKGLEKEQRDESPTGSHLISNEFEILEKTNNVPAQIGVAFGSSFSVRAQTEKSVELEIVWVPANPMITPEGKTIHEVRYDNTVWTNNETFCFYLFEEGFELKTGTWLFQVYLEDKKLFQRKFKVD